MSKTYKIAMTVSNDQIKDLFCLYLYQLDGKRSKKDFNDYIKGKLKGNGQDEFLTPLNMDDYDGLNEYDISCLKKWKLI